MAQQKQQSTAKKNGNVNGSQGTADFENLFGKDSKKFDEIEEELKGARGDGKSANADVFGDGGLGSKKSVKAEGPIADTGQGAFGGAPPKWPSFDFHSGAHWFVSRVIFGKNWPSIFLWGGVSIFFLCIAFLEGAVIYSTKLMFFADVGVNTPDFSDFPLLENVSFLSGYNLAILEAFLMAIGVVGLNHVMMLACVFLFFQVIWFCNGEGVKIAWFVATFCVIVLLLLLSMPLSIQYFDALLNMTGSGMEDLDMPMASISPAPFISLIYTISLLSALSEYKLLKALLSK